MTRAPLLKALSAEDLQPKACVVLGTRPGIVMLSPVIRELERAGLPFFVLHTGQHYSHDMDRRFFEDLELREPEHQLDLAGAGGGHGAQTGEMLRACEEVLVAERPRLVLVGGDANTNLAGALAARKLHIRVGHVEAGERSYDWRMPEEHNRVIIDHISEYLFTTNEKGLENLRADGVRGEVVVTGNPIVDATAQNLGIAGRRSRVLERLGLAPSGHAVLTAHREENVDSPEVLSAILDGAARVAAEVCAPVVFPAHPRTRRRLAEFGLEERAAALPGVLLVEPLGYLDFLRLVACAGLVLTDSGGVQQEACILRVPCVTLRDVTEWTETVRLGANALAGCDPEAIAACARAMIAVERDWADPFGDGRAARRIVAVVERALAGTGPRPWEGAEPAAPRIRRVASG